MIPENYKITDEMEYSVDLYEWKKDHWEALVEKNLQLHFIMLDPYIIANLEQRKEGSPNYFVQMKIPDKLGVFHFKIFYDKPGYNYLEISTKVSLLSILPPLSF
jgi:oligosaccharyltransferase complex subunit beta